MGVIGEYDLPRTRSSMPAAWIPGTLAIYPTRKKDKLSQAKSTRNEFAKGKSSHEEF